MAHLCSARQDNGFIQVGSIQFVAHGLLAGACSSLHREEMQSTHFAP